MPVSNEIWGPPTRRHFFPDSHASIAEGGGGKQSLLFDFQQQILKKLPCNAKFQLFFKSFLSEQISKVHPCQDFEKDNMHKPFLVFSTSYFPPVFFCFVENTQLGTLEWQISGLMLDPLLFLISRLNIACSPHADINLQIN